MQKECHTRRENGADVPPSFRAALARKGYSGGEIPDNPALLGLPRCVSDAAPSLARHRTDTDAPL
jgi:hypothetical protein